MMRRLEVDVAIVGAGPAGLAAACLVAKAGFQTCLISSVRTDAAPDPRTVALMQPAIRMLSYLGLSAEAADLEGSPLWRLKLIDDTGAWLAPPPAVFDAREIGDRPFGWNLPLAPLVVELSRIAEALGVAVLRDDAHTLGRGTDEAQILLRGGRTVNARVILAADGSRSKLREQTGIETVSWSYHQDAITARFDHSAPHQDTSIEFHKSGGPLTTVPLRGARSSLVWLVAPERSLELINLTPDEFARVLQAELHGVLGHVSNARPRHVFPMRGLTAVRFAARRTLFLGETAHLVPPIGAQGLNMSFRDAATAADLVMNARAHGQDIGGSKVTDAYDRVRRRDVVTRQGIVHAVNWSLLSGWALPHAARAFGLRAGASIPALRKAIMRQGMGANDDLPEAMRG